MMTASTYLHLALICFLTVELVSCYGEKLGSCGKHVKRSACNCGPTGTDTCQDQCQNDVDCPGLRKCCNDGCQQSCKLPQLTAASAITQQQCPQGEEYNYCGPCRAPTCAQPIANRTECTSGCFCPPGYVRNADGRCVKPKDCPPPPPPTQPVCAGRHEVYNACYKGCQGSCNNPGAKNCFSNACVSGCFCAPGYVRSGTGRCISPQSCPAPLSLFAPAPPLPTCPPDQEFAVCRRECEPSCLNPTQTGCRRECQNGCFCKSGLVRDHWGKCIAASACPIKTTAQPFCASDREKFMLCHNKCQATCHDPNAQRCNSRCLTGCFCIQGYVRHEGNCIPLDQCPLPDVSVPTPSTPICENDFQVYESCYRGCERTCSNPTGTGCSTAECRSGCYCQPHLVRNHFGQCVAPNQCPTCGFHEHIEDEAPSCPQTCPQTRCQPNGQQDNYQRGGQQENYQRGGQQESYQRGSDQYQSGSQGGNNRVQYSSAEQTRTYGQQSGCYCDPGYVRNLADGSCIPNGQCQSANGGGSRQQSGGCGFGEEQVNCGASCQQGCANGLSSGNCPSNCRTKCCRRKLRLF